jgi:hypothetical protein
MSIWTTYAHCREFHPLFDAEIHGETPTEQRHRVAQAKAMCVGCPVIATCELTVRDLAAAGELVEGVWAGRWHPSIKAQRASNAAA